MTLLSSPLAWATRICEATVSSTSCHDASLPETEMRDGQRPMKLSSPQATPAAMRAAALVLFALRNEATPPASHEAAPTTASATRCDLAMARTPIDFGSGEV